MRVCVGVWILSKLSMCAMLQAIGLAAKSRHDELACCTILRCQATDGEPFAVLHEIRSKLSMGAMQNPPGLVKTC